MGNRAIQSLQLFPAIVPMYQTTRVFLRRPIKSPICLLNITPQIGGPTMSSWMTQHQGLLVISLSTGPLSWGLDSTITLSRASSCVMLWTCLKGRRLSTLCSASAHCGAIGGRTMFPPLLGWKTGPCSLRPQLKDPLRPYQSRWKHERCIEYSARTINIVTTVRSIWTNPRWPP